MTRRRHTSRASGHTRSENVAFAKPWRNIDVMQLHPSDQLPFDPIEPTGLQPPLGRDPEEPIASSTEQSLTGSPPESTPQRTGEPNWKELCVQLSRGLQQAHDAYRRAREEWDVHRQLLERRLVEYSDACQQLGQQYKQDLLDANILVQSMQQERKYLLAQLKDAKQTIRQDLNRYKRRQSLVNTVWSLISVSPSRDEVSDAAHNTARNERPADFAPPVPSALVQSACPTQSMSAPPTAAEPEPDEPVVPTLALRPEDLPQRRDLAARPASVAHEQLDPSAPARVQDPASAAALGDCESVTQEYMRRLLERVARVAGDQGTPANRLAAQLGDNSSSPSAGAAAAEPEQSLIHSTLVSADGVPASLLSLIQMGTDSSAATATPPMAHVPKSSATAKGKAETPTADELSQGAAELAAELLAMRQPPIRATTSAIDQKVYRQLVITAWSEITVATVCLISGLIACLLSERLFSADMFGGALGISFGTILLPRGIRVCVRLKQIKALIECESTA